MPQEPEPAEPPEAPGPAAPLAEHEANCGGELKILAAILEQAVIEKILTHLGLQARAPPCAPARERALQAA